MNREKHFTQEKIDEYRSTFPCPDCIVLATCKHKNKKECSLVIKWLYYDSYNVDIVKFKKTIFDGFFEWTQSHRYQVTYINDQSVIFYLEKLLPWPHY